MPRRRCLSLFAALAILATLQSSATAQVRKRLHDICTVATQRTEIRLTGIGLVVALDGTGDGKSALPGIHRIAQVLDLPESQRQQLILALDANSVAAVAVEVIVAPTGAAKGQKLDCVVSCLGRAKSLKGGRLLACQMEHSGGSAIAAGHIEIEKEHFKSGSISKGATLQSDFPSGFVDSKSSITLVIDPDYATFQNTVEIARDVNTDFRFEAGTNVARAIHAGRVELQIPAVYRDSPVEFVAAALAIAIENVESVTMRKCPSD